LLTPGGGVGGGQGQLPQGVTVKKVGWDAKVRDWRTWSR
jgi:hypothetical protein